MHIIITITLLTHFLVKSAAELVELATTCSKLRYTPDPFSPFPSSFQPQKCYLNKEVIERLCELQEELFKFSASQLAPKIIYLKILECYRSEQLDLEKYLWTFNMSFDESYPMKKIFYPNLKNKEELRGIYIQKYSDFQTGNTVGLTLSYNSGMDTKDITKVSLSELASLPSCFAQNGKRAKFDTSIEMGNFYAYPDYINDYTIYKNRVFLKLLMEKYGFVRANSINSFQFTLKQ